MFSLKYEVTEGEHRYLYNATKSGPRRQVWVSDAPAINPGKEPGYPSFRRLGEPKSLS
jgi:hypothetical protein